MRRPSATFYKKRTSGEQRHQAFRRKLLTWYRQAARDLPWRRTRDPYRIWVSEIMLQQTRVATVLPYYERFLDRFPTVEALAQAPEPELLSTWSGLGYYSRARNMHKAAREIDGRFPETYEGIRGLAGVGDYTAAAIASIAFGLPHAAVDGNVLRVLARVTGDRGDIGAPATRKRLADVASSLLDPADPGAFNEAMMELGATVCLPRNPQCLVCPVSEECAARAEGVQQELPVKARRQDPVKLERTVYLVQRGGEILLWQRPAAERLMPGFWDVPEAAQLPGAEVLRRAGEFRHSITHHNYTFTVVCATVPKRPRGMQWVTLDQLEGMPLTTISRKALRFLGQGC